MARLHLVLFCIALVALEAFAEEPLHVRAKRQQCRCVRNQVGGGMTCSCTKPTGSNGAAATTAEIVQQNDLAQELQVMQTTATHTQARCACLQIVFQGNPQYQCQCGDQNGNPLPTTTTAAPTTTTTTTTTPAPTTTTTLPPTATTPHYEPIPTTIPNGQGQCQCIMIRISGPASAHYQCNCQNTPAPSMEVPQTTATTTTPVPVTMPPVTLPPYVAPTTIAPAVYPPVGTINSTEQGCFCVDQPTQTIQPACGCSCNCITMLCTMPTGVCACPQDVYGQPAAAPAMETTFAPVYEQVFSTQAPVTVPATVATVATEAPQPAAAVPDSTYPLTTTCVMYVGVQASPCMCLPQYDQCAQNICCLKAKFRSLKKTAYHDQQSPAEPSTIDMLMNVLQKIKTKLNH